jgi:hypothetical protein
MYTNHALAFTGVTAVAIVPPASGFYGLLLTVTGVLFGLVILIALTVLATGFLLRGIDAGARAYRRRGGIR